MKYYKWKLKWEVNPATGSEEGTDPTFSVNNDVVRVEPHFYIPTGDRYTEWYYAYGIKGELNTADLTDWSVSEITSADMLAAAQQINTDAAMVDGLVVFPAPENPA